MQTKFKIGSNKQVKRIMALLVSVCLLISSFLNVNIFSFAQVSEDAKMLEISTKGDSVFGQKITLTQGKTYTFTYMLRATKGKFSGNSASDNIKIGFRSFNSGSNAYNNNKFVNGNSNTIVDDGLYSYTYTFTVGASDPTKYLMCVNTDFTDTTETKFYLYNLKLVEGTDTTNLLNDVDFSSGISNNWLHTNYAKEMTFANRAHNIVKDSQNNIVEFTGCHDSGATIETADNKVTVRVIDYIEDMFKRDVYFVDRTNGSDSSNTTGGPLDPFQFIQKAMSVIETNEKISSGTIKLIGESNNFTSSAHTKPITITSSDPENLSPLGEAMGCSPKGPVTFEKLIIGKSFYMVTDGYEVTFKDITVPQNYGSESLVPVGLRMGPSEESDRTSVVNLNGLGDSKNRSVKFFIGGDPGSNQSVSGGGLDLTIDNSYLFRLMFHNKKSIFKGDVNITFNSGCVYDFSLENNAVKPDIDGAFTLILNNNAKYNPEGTRNRFVMSTDVKDNISADGGEWYMYSDKTGGRLEATGTPGTFNVKYEGSTVYYAKATNLSTNKVTYSGTDGKLVVPEGQYDVTYIKSLPITDAQMMHIVSDGDDDWGQRIQLEQGKTYTAKLKLFIKKGTFTGTENDSFYLGVRKVVNNNLTAWYNSTHGSNQSTVKPLILKKIDDNLFEYTYEFTYQQATEICQFGFGVRTNQEADFFVADMSLVENSNPDKNLLKNSNYGEGLNDDWSAKYNVHASNSSANVISTKYDGSEFYNTFKYDGLSVELLPYIEDTFKRHEIDAYYVSETGNDDNSGTKQDPFKTIEEAMRQLEFSTAEKGTVYLEGKVELTTYPHTKPITITSVDTEEIATLIPYTGWTAHGISANGELTIDNVIIDSNMASSKPQNEMYFKTEGNKVTIKNITSNGVNGTIFIGPTKSTNNKDIVNLENIGSGQWNSYMFRIGTNASKGDTEIVSGGAEITLSGSNYIHGIAFRGKTVYNGDVNIIVNGAKLNSVFGFENGANPTFNGALQIILNNGIKKNFQIDESLINANAKDGVFIMYTDLSGAQLETTDTEGVFKVLSAGEVYATNRANGNKIASVNGVLTVPAGVYDVSSDIDGVIYGSKMMHISNGSDKDYTWGQNVKLEKGKEYKFNVKLATERKSTLYYVAIRKLEQTDANSRRYVYVKSMHFKDNRKIDWELADNGLYDYTFSFTHEDDSGEYFLAIYPQERAEMYVAQPNLYAVDKPDDNLIVNADLTEGLNNWIENWYGAPKDGSMEYKSGEFKVNVEKYDASKFAIPDGSFTDNHNMIYVVNGTGYSGLNQRFVNIIKPGHTYILEYSAVTKFGMRVSVSEYGESTPFINGAYAKETIVDESYEHNKTAKFELKMPEDLGINIQFSIRIDASESFYAFDFKLYDKDDAEKRNLFENGDFSKGLDNWIWCYDPFWPGKQGYGLTNYTNKNGYIETMPFDLEKTIPFDNDSRFNDGVWWSNEDVKTYCQLSGVFVDEKSNPISDAKLVLEGDIKYSTKTDAKGNFVFKDVAEGKYDLYVVGADGELRYTGYTVDLKHLDNLKIKIVSNTESGEIRIPNGAIHANVYTPDRKPVADLTIRINDMETTTNSEGYFEFNNLEGGDYEIIAVDAKGEKYVLSKITLKEDTVMNLKLKYDPSLISDTNNTYNNYKPMWFIILGSAGIVIAISVIAFFIIRARKSKKPNI